MKKEKSVKPSKKVEVEKKFEERDDLKKMFMYVVIVPFGQGENIIRLFKNNRSSAQFIRVGEGTANKEIRDILSIDDMRKEIVYSIMAEEYIEDFKKELEAYFAASKKNAGVGFTIELNSLVGVKVYKFLSQTVRG